MTAAIHITWQTRDVPLQPLAVAAAGIVAARLVDRLLTFTDDVLLRLRGVAGPGLLVLTGESGELPWLDGVVYLGRDPLAPGLYVPTTLAPTPAIALLERALCGRHSRLGSPLALVPREPGMGPRSEPGPEDASFVTAAPPEPRDRPLTGEDRRSFIAAVPPPVAISSPPAPLRLVSLADARPLVRARLVAWRGRA